MATQWTMSNQMPLRLVFLTGHLDWSYFDQLVHFNSRSPCPAIIFSADNNYKFNIVTKLSAHRYPKGHLKPEYKETRMVLSYE